MYCPKALLSAVVVFAFFAGAFAQTRVFPSATYQAESHIAINPTDPNNLIVVAITGAPAASKRIGAYYTTNGGASWLYPSREI